MSTLKTWSRAVPIAAVVLAGLLAHRGTRSEVKADPKAPASASAAASVAPGNLELSADLLEVDTREQTAVLTGKVVLSRAPDLTLKCAKIEVKYDAGGPKLNWAKGSGGIVADVKGVHGEAPEFELDLTKQHLSLRGGVRLSRGQGWIVADGAEIDLATAKVTMTNVKASLPVGNALKK